MTLSITSYVHLVLPKSINSECCINQSFIFYVHRTLQVSRFGWCHVLSILYRNNPWNTVATTIDSCRHSNSVTFLTRHREWRLDTKVKLLCRYRRLDIILHQSRWKHWAEDNDMVTQLSCQILKFDRNVVIKKVTATFVLREYE